MTRSTVVNTLVRQMVDVLESTASDASADEVLSAALTIGLRTITASIKLGADPRQVQRAVETLMLACADECQAN